MRTLFGIAVLLAGGLLGVVINAVQVPDIPDDHQAVGWVESLGLGLEGDQNHGGLGGSSIEEELLGLHLDQDGGFFDDAFNQMHNWEEEEEDGLLGAGLAIENATDGPILSWNDEAEWRYGGFVFHDDDDAHGAVLPVEEHVNGTDIDADADTDTNGSISWEEFVELEPLRLEHENGESSAAATRQDSTDRIKEHPILPLVDIIDSPVIPVDKTEKPSRRRRGNEESAHGTSKQKLAMATLLAAYLTFGTDGFEEEKEPEPETPPREKIQVPSQVYGPNGPDDGNSVRPPPSRQPYSGLSPCPERIIPVPEEMSLSEYLVRSKNNNYCSLPKVKARLYSMTDHRKLHIMHVTSKHLETMMLKSRGVTAPLTKDDILHFNLDENDYILSRTHGYAEESSKSSVLQFVHEATTRLRSLFICPICPSRSAKEFFLLEILYRHMNVVHPDRVGSLPSLREAVFRGYDEPGRWRYENATKTIVTLHPQDPPRLSSCLPLTDEALKMYDKFLEIEDCIRGDTDCQTNQPPTMAIAMALYHEKHLSNAHFVLPEHDISQSASPFSPQPPPPTNQEPLGQQSTTLASHLYQPPSPSHPTTLGKHKHHPCPSCHKHFLHPHQRRKHEKTHTKPEKCEEPNCRWAFALKKDLRRHQASVHAGEQIRCTVGACEAVFTRRDNLLRHVSKVHG